MDTNKIYDATNYQELHTALQEMMEEITREWWNGLDSNAKNAIRLLGFSHTVVSSMMFFSDRMDSVYLLLAIPYGVTCWYARLKGFLLKIRQMIFGRHFRLLTVLPIRN